LQSRGTANIFSGTVAVVVPDHGSSSDTALASSLEEDGTPSVLARICYRKRLLGTASNKLHQPAALRPSS